ncbi:anti-lipopolysaccharide factor-like [Penaeus japonicus]|uniref:anti-lipopolysaccharide factor-like n=1 Tax=Penaeus japonicus TaxID=27405 RepID=UPI001C716E77|nr:anti-lipopolysaccharide factor-like [Penaeus japonicus]
MMTSPKPSRVAVFSCLCLLLFASASARPQFNIGGILGSVVETFVEEAYETREITLFDNYCVLTRSPYVKRLEVHYRADVKCPGWTPIVGKGRDHTNPTNSEMDAIKDFVRQALGKGLVTADEAAEWL